MEDTVISVRDASMRFKMSAKGYSGMKDYLIQRIKGQLDIKTLNAVDHVSFDVKRGEVLGIIGTNGAGKSTLLKMISGALKPTEGEIEVDRSKIQILTYGAGFDGELTAKENVYLNGAICGYSKEFIDANYDDIVSFAGLENFMDEKVRNFSSGMNSRLGFSIATAGAAAEILILDEVLAVGDEFFRKKSMARVKEMIHSGSTVIMVSHGMGNITGNCTRAIWMEHGRVIMDGDPKTVCAEYSKSGVEDESVLSV